MDEARLFSVVPSDWVQTETRKVASEYQETLSHCDGDQTLAQVAQEACGSSILGDNQKSCGDGSGQLAVNDPA